MSQLLSTGILQNAIIDILLISSPIIYIALIEKRFANPSDFGLQQKASWAKDAFLSAKILVALLAASFFLTTIFNYIGMSDFWPVEKVIKGLASAGPLSLAYFFIVRVFAEELFFRAFLVPRIGTLGSSILFGASHIMYGSVAEAAGAFALGMILAQFYTMEKRIVPNCVGHALYNAAAFAMVISA